MDEARVNEAPVLAVFAPTPAGGHPEYVRKLLAGLHAAAPELRLYWPIREDFDQANAVAAVQSFVSIPAMPERREVGTFRWLLARCKPSLRHDVAFMKAVALIGPSHVLIEEVQRLRTHWLVRSLRSRGVIPILHLHNVRRHDYRGSLLDRIVEWDLGRALRAAEVVVVHTSGAAALVRERFGSRIRCVVIPHGMARRLEVPSVPSRLNSVVFYGVNRPNKGLDLIVEAVNQIDARMELELVVAGVTPHEFREETTVLLGRVHHAVDWVDRFISDSETERIMRQAAVVVLPYRDFEAQSGVLHLATEWGVPVVATDVGGMAEALKEFDSGVVVAPGSPSELAAAVEQVLDPTTNSRLRESALRAATAHSWERAGAALACLLGDLP